MAFLDKTGLERLWLHILSKTNQTLASAKQYADDIKNDLLNGAGGAYDTLKELGDLIDENADAIDAIQRLADTKSDKGHIHDDRYYTEAEVDDALKFVKEASGEVIAVNDSAEQNLVGLKLYGKTTQTTTTGKNLLKNTSGTKGSNDLVFRYAPSDGTVTINGTATANSWYAVSDNIGLPAGQYIVNGNTGGSDNTYFLYAIVKRNGADTNYVVRNGEDVQFTVIDGDTVSCYICVYQGVTLNNHKMFPMIRLASVTDATYEPYTGGIPSPNPNYPQELMNAGAGGSITAGAIGANLLRNTAVSQSNGGVTFAVNGDGAVIANGTVTGSYALLIIDVDVNLPETQAMLSGCPIVPGCKLVCYSANLNGLGLEDTGYGAIITDVSVVKHIGIYIAAGTTCDNIVFRPMIVLGSAAMPYAPYKDGGSVTVSTPNGLPGIPVTSGGSYTDANGQQWVCDEIDFERGVYVKRVGRAICDSSNAVFAQTGLWYVNGIIANTIGGRLGVLASHYKAYGTAELKHGNVCINGLGMIVFGNENYTDEATMRADLAQNPVTIAFVLPVSGEIPLSESELSAYRAMTSQKPNTTVYNDAGAGMTVEYADIKIDDIEKALNLPEIDSTLTLSNAAAEAQIVGKKLQHLQEETQFLDEAKGSFITVDNSAELPLNNLKLYGKTIQTTTTGKNLANCSDKENVSATTYFPIIPLNIDILSPGQTYTLSAEIKSSVVPFHATVGRGANTHEIDVATVYDQQNGLVKITFTVPENYAESSGKKWFLCAPRYYASTAITYSVKNVQVEVGSTATSYEPYTGGIPSPNPDYPQELVSVGDGGSIGVKTTGKNLLPINSINTNQNDAGLIELTYLPVGTYTLSADITKYADDTATNTRMTCSIIYTDGQTEGFSTDFDVNKAENDGITRRKQRSFLIRADKKVQRIVVYALDYSVPGSGRNAKAENIQIEYGPTATAYEPYKDSGTLAISTPNGLPGIPVTSGGNYTDASGQQWVCDEKDYGRGVYVQRVMKLTIDGSTDEFIRKNTTDSNDWLHYIELPYAKQIFSRGYCDKLQEREIYTLQQYGGIGYLLNTEYGVCYINMSSYMEDNSVAALRNVLAANPITIIYILKTPIETPLSESELAAYRAMSTQYPTTTIYNDAAADMYVSYGTYKAGEIEEALGIPKVDKTLSMEGASADAKTVGDILNNQYSVKRETGDIISVDTVEGLAIHPTTYIEPIQSGSGDPSPENIRPISGWDSAAVHRTGKNLLGGFGSITINGVTVTETETGWKLNGTPVSDYGYKAIFDAVLPAGTYALNGVAGGSGNTYQIVVYINGTPKVYAQNANTKIVLADASKVEMLLYLYGAHGSFNNVVLPYQLEAGSAATAYEPYQGQTLATTLPETVYGGKLNWTTGVLTVTHKKGVIDNVSALYNTTDNLTGFYTNVPDMAVEGRANGWCDVLPARSTPSGATNPCITFGAGYHDLFIIMPTTMVGTTLETINAYLADNPLNIVYPLETPITYQLTPQQLLTIEGQNNIWSNAGETEALVNLTPINTLKNISSTIDSKLDKTTYEYNKELALSYSGKVCIGKFPAYDSNISVEIKSTTDITYNGTLIIATQNINTTGGGGYSATVYGDVNNILANSIKIHYGSGSNVFSVYIDLPSWSKNLLHIQCVNLAGTPTDIATIVSSIPEEATIVPVNALQATYATKNELSTTANSKQNTITGAATTITSNDLIANRALVSNGSGKVAASEITGAELHCLDGITDNIQTQLNGKTQKINLHGQLQTASYLTSVIALCKAPTTDSSNLNSYSSGRITFQRENALYSPRFVDITMAAAWGAVNRVRAQFVKYGTFVKFALCTFTYNGTTYGGIEFKIDNAEASRVTFDGTTTFGIFGLDIYNSDTQTILNEEVYNSISYDNVIVESGIFDGSGQFITTGNIGSQSVNYANSAGKATQDANGNVITNTYATKAEIPKNILDGAASGSLRTLGSPELVKSGSHYVTHTLGADAFAGGWESYAEGENSFAFGHEAWAKGMNSHAEGNQTHADGKNSHAEGLSTFATGLDSHAEGYATHANGTCSHAEGTGTIATSDSSHAQGKYNIEDTASTYAHIVGNGTSSSARSNAHTLDWNGNAWFKGSIYVGGTGQTDTAAVMVLPAKLVSTETNPSTNNTIYWLYE